MAKILSIEIGNSITRVCEMDYKVKNPKVYKYFSFATPKGVLEDGFVHESPEFVIALKGGMHENKIKTKQAIFTVTSTKIVTREVTVPSLKPAQLATYIKSNANDYFPIDLSMYEIAHVVLGADPTDETGSKQRVMVMAAGKDLIAGYITLANTCGLKLICIDYAGNSIFQLMKSECDSDIATLVVRIEDNNTMASVISNGNLVLQRSLAYGTERVAKAVMNSHEFYETEEPAAFRLLCQKPVLKVVLSDRTRVVERDEAQFESDAKEEARQNVTATLTQLIGNLVRVCELYNSKEPLNPIKKVVLCGIGAEIVNLPKLFRNEMGINTSVITDINSLGVTRVGEESMGRYIGAIGATLEPVGLMTVGSKSREKKAVNYGLYTILAFVAVIAILAGLFLKTYIPYNNAVKEEERLKNLEATYAPAEIVHKQYTSIEAMYNEVVAKMELTESNNDNVIAFLDELETKLPSDAKLKSFASNNESVALLVHVANYDEAGKVLQILREFDTLKTVTIVGLEPADGGEVEAEAAVGEGTDADPDAPDATGATTSEEEDGEETPKETGIDMAVTCTYYPNGATE